MSTELEQLFPYSQRSKKFHWRVVDLSHGPSMQLPESLLISPHNIAPKELLKSGRRRLIFCCSLMVADKKLELLVKGFPLKKLKECLRYRRYALTEAMNLARAKKRGLPVPEVHAVGVRRRMIGSNLTAVVMSYLPCPSMLELLHSPTTEHTPERLLQRSGKLIQMLYRQGANHIDFGPHAILLSADSTQPDTIIDWQYAIFMERTKPQLLATLAGHFAWSVATNRNYFSPATMHAWFTHLLEEAEIKKSPTLESLFHKSLNERGTRKERFQRPL